MRKFLLAVLLLSAILIPARGVCSPTEVRAFPRETINSVPVPPVTLAWIGPDEAKAEGTTAVPGEPTSIGEAVDAGKKALAAGQAGQWWYLSSLVCLILMFALKAFKVFEKIGRWKYVILPILSLAAALLAAFQGEVNLTTAIGVFGSTWSMGMLEELVNHGILGKPHVNVKPV